MQKIEFGDINKFLVSVGLVLIALAVIMPYLYLKEDFGLYIEYEKILKLDSEVQKIFINKKHLISIIQSIIPWSSAIFFGLGVLISGIGINRWLKRQRKIDEKFDKEIIMLDIEIQSSTPEEKIENAKQEVKEIELDEKLESKNISSIPTKGHEVYMEIEEHLFQLFKRMNSPNFRVYQEPKIGDKFYVDILLKSNSSRFSDRIVEIKYFSNQLLISTIEKALYQLGTYISYYGGITKKPVVPILLLVYRDNIVNASSLAKAKEKVEFFIKDIPEFRRLKVEFIAESKLQKFDVKELLKR